MTQPNIQPPPLPAVVQVQMTQGRYFQFPVPPGWQWNETDSGVDLKSPDGATVVGIPARIVRIYDKRVGVRDPAEPESPVTTY